MKNKFFDLNNHLFAQLERLGDEELTGDKLVEEISRAKSVADVAQQIIANGSLVLKAETFRHEYGIDIKNEDSKKIPPMLRASFLEE
jgi:hypothetical protein